MSNKKYKYIRIFGMGGSSLGANAIYDFLKFKIKRDFYLCVVFMFSYLT